MNITQGFCMVNTRGPRNEREASAAQHPFAPGVIARSRRPRRSLKVSAQIVAIYLSLVVIVCGLAGIAWQEINNTDFTPVANFILAIVPNI